MLPAGLVNILTVCLGSLLPAYATYRSLHEERPQAQLVLLVYWATHALFCAGQLVTDALLFWLPLYGELKLLLLLWLLTPQYRGAVLVYRSVVHPYLDRNREKIEAYLAGSRLLGHLWALSGTARFFVAAVYTVARTVWLITSSSSPAPLTQPARSASQPPPTAPLFASLHLQALGGPDSSVVSSPSPSSFDTPPQGPPAQSGAAPPLDTRPMAALSANLEESCHMLLRTALAAQAGNQLLAALEQAGAAVTAGAAAPHAAPRSRPSRYRSATTTTTAAGRELPQTQQRAPPTRSARQPRSTSSDA